MVIVLDDGIATGSTMIAALRAVRARHPAKVIAATAVASEETLQRIGREADEVVCLEVPELLYAIGAHFRDFSAVDCTCGGRALRVARASSTHSASRPRTIRRSCNEPLPAVTVYWRSPRPSSL